MRNKRTNLLRLRLFLLLRVLLDWHSSWYSLSMFVGASSRRQWTLWCSAGVGGGRIQHLFICLFVFRIQLRASQVLPQSCIPAPYAAFHPGRPLGRGGSHSLVACSRECPPCPTENLELVTVIKLFCGREWPQLLGGESLE